MKPKLKVNSNTQYFQKYTPDYFALGDINKDDHIDYNEFCMIYETFDLPLETTKVKKKKFRI